MQKTIYRDYKYAMQDTSRIYVGCKYTFSELAEDEEVPFKFRLVVQKYIVPNVDGEDTLETFREKQAHLKVVMKTKNVTYNWHDAETSVLEGVIARGDRRQGRAILLAWQRGCKMDGWDQCFDFEKWIQAFHDCGLDPEFYASRQRPMDEVFPWDHIGCGTRKEHLKREWERSREAVITPDCMHQCAGCGASALLKGGKCRV